MILIIIKNQTGGYERTEIMKRAGLEATISFYFENEKQWSDSFVAS